MDTLERLRDLERVMHFNGWGGRGDICTAAIARIKELEAEVSRLRGERAPVRETACECVFRYVSPSDVPRRLALGWCFAGNLGQPHSNYCVLMEFLCCCGKEAS